MKKLFNYIIMIQQCWPTRLEKYLNFIPKYKACSWHDKKILIYYKSKYRGSSVLLSLFIWLNL